MAENDGTASVTVVLSAQSGLPITVDYTTGDLTGKAGIDYSPASGTLTCVAGTTSRTFSIDLIDNNLDNNDKTVNLVLSRPDSAALGSPSTAVLTIQDDESMPALELTVLPEQVDEGSGTVNLTATLSEASGKTVTVHYVISPGTASAGSDYEAVTGELVFDPGETQQVVAIHLVDDAVNEPDETLMKFHTIIFHRSRSIDSS